MTDQAHVANFWNVIVPLKSVKIGMVVVYVDKLRNGDRRDVEPCNFGHIVGFGVVTQRKGDHQWLTHEVLAAKVQFSAHGEPEVVPFDKLELL